MFNLNNKCILTIKAFSKTSQQLAAIFPIFVQPMYNQTTQNTVTRIPIALLLLLALFALSANDNHRYNFSRALDQRENDWVDSLFNSMTENERLGQLLMIRAHSDKDSVYEQQVEDLIRNFHVGGLCFFQGTPEKQAVLTNRYQAASGKMPLMISMDAEWGLGMRMRESTISYPRQLMLGAIRDNKLVYEMGREVARQCRRMGVHINFAPVADVNNNPSNPVINDRSFGEDRYNVAAKCFQYMLGMQDGGVMACAKHFPGHGDTDVDSHYDLPVISHDRKRLDSLELFPFRVLSQYGVASFMVAHLNVPALDVRPKRPTTLSESTVYGLLRRQIGFDGLIFTDAMEMQGVAKYFINGEAEKEALRAGNDIILLPANVEQTLEAFRSGLADGTLNLDRVHASVRRVLRAKYRLGLTVPQRVEVQGIRAELNRPEALALKRRLIENALTLVRDKQNVCGFPKLNGLRIATLALGDTNLTVFQNTCGLYAPMHHLQAPKTIDGTLEQRLLDTLKGYDMVLLSLHNMSSRASLEYGISPEQKKLIQTIIARQPTVLTVFGNPYSLRWFDNAPTLLAAYNEDPMTQELTAQALFGANNLRGQLPVTASPMAHYGQGVVKSFENQRLGYEVPEAVGLSTDTLRLLDTYLEEIVRKGAAPGGQILVAKNNRIVWHKAFGRFTYDSTSTRVTTDHLYDIASVTKVAASTLTAMRLYEQGQLDLQQTLTCYVPELANTNKKDLRVDETMIHQAGLTPWIAFYKTTLDLNGFPNRHIYHTQADGDSEYAVAPSMFMDNARADTLWNTIFFSPLRGVKDYKYSDLGLYLLARAMGNITGESLDMYATRNFYAPMGMKTLYNPWKKGLADQCAPTEEDRYFRQQRVQGYVHDMGAAMLGGVSGHAGLFSNANDLAKIFQMLLNGGTYGGQQYFKPETVQMFTSRYGGSTRRGLGFDMKELNPEASANMGKLAGPNTFGHLGFTGICAWADPDQQLIFIFISNRTYPTMENNKLINGDYRPKMQDVVYRALQKKS